MLSLRPDKNMWIDVILQSGGYKDSDGNAVALEWKGGNPQGNLEKCVGIGYDPIGNFDFFCNNQNGVISSEVWCL